MQVSPYEQSTIQPAIGVNVKKSVYENVKPVPPWTYGSDYEGLAIATKLWSQLSGYWVIVKVWILTWLFVAMQLMQIEAVYPSFTFWL